MNKKVLLSILTLIISIGVKADLDKAIAYAEAGEKDKEEWDWYWYGMSIYKRPKLQPTVCEPTGGYDRYGIR